MVVLESQLGKDKQMTISKKLILTGLLSILVLNPLSVNLLGDALVVAVNTSVKYLVFGSGYIMAVSATLIVVGGILMYGDYRATEATRLKKLAKTKTSKAGKYLEA